jgi:hypothetical protein
VPTCWLSGRMHTVWSPNGPQDESACRPYPARPSVVVSYLVRTVTQVCPGASLPRLVGVGGGCHRPQSGYHYCRLVSPRPGGAVRPHGGCYPETSEVADDSHPTAGLPARGRMADHRRAAAGRVLGRWLGQQMAEPRGSSVRHHPGGWIPPDDSRASPSSAPHARFAARPGYGPSLVRHAHGVGNRRWPGHLLGPQSARIGCGPASLWSDVVVSFAANRVGRDRLLRRCRPCVREGRSTWHSRPGCLTWYDDCRARWCQWVSAIRPPSALRQAAAGHLQVGVG